MALQGFDKNYFLQKALEVLQVQDPDTWTGQNVAYLEEQLAVYNFTPQDLYEMWGWKYDLAPNAYFDKDYYINELSAWAVANDYFDTAMAAKAAIEDAWAGQDFYQHYLQYGSPSDINPSAAFDESSYLDNLFAWAQQEAPDALVSLGIADAAQLRTFFNDNGVSALGNYIDYGYLAGINPVPVSGINIEREMAGTADIMRLTGDRAVRIDFSNPANQIKGLDLDGDGTIQADGVENTITGMASGFEIVDAYARNPLNEGDKTNNFLGDIEFDGTGYAGDGVNTDGNIFLGGMGADKAFGGIGNDFMAGGGVAGNRNIGDYLSGGRNADFFFTELSALDKTDGLQSTFDGGNTTDDSAAGLAENLSGVNSQNNDWILLEASDDDETVIVNLGANFDSDGDGVTEQNGGSIITHSGRQSFISDIESIDASGNLYGHINDIDVEIGGRATDLRSTDHVVGTENYGIGSTAQLNVNGSTAANVVIGSYDNDKINGGAGNDILIGGNLAFLLAHKNNPNLLNSSGGLELNVNGANTINDGRDEILGGNDDDNIVFEMDGGAIDGGADHGTSSGADAKRTGDTVWLTDFSSGRMNGITVNDDAAQDAALDALTTDSVVRMDLGNTNNALNFINYGGSDRVDRPSQDQTNYVDAYNVRSVQMTGVESVIATGLGAIDFKAAGKNSPELQFNNQQNFQAIDADLDLRGSGLDNTLYANTGKDIIEGRTGDDNLSGGKDDDVFIFQFGDGVDLVHRQLDADNNNIWMDDLGQCLFTQDFRAPQQGDIESSRLTIDFGDTDLTSANVTVGLFNLVIGGTSFTVPYDQLVAAKSATALAEVVNAAYHTVDPNVSVTALNEHTLVVTDTEGRDISDTIEEGYAVGVILGNGSAETQAIFSPGGTPIDVVEDDILVFKTYQNRSINLGVNETIEEINNAVQLVARFDETGTQLSDNQSYLVKLTNINEGDTVTITINGKNYSYTARAQENSGIVANNLANAINHELDLNSGSGRITATGDNTAVDTDGDGIGDTVQLLSASSEFDDQVLTSDATDLTVSNEAGNAIAVLRVTQAAVEASETYMNISVSVTNALTGTSAGFASVHNQSGTHIDLVGFDGRDGNINGEDVLFLGRGEETVSLFQTAVNEGQTITGLDATLDPDTPTGIYNWINGDDLLYGGEGNDIINAGTGDDRVMVSKGEDTVDGGANSINPSPDGTDTYVDPGADKLYGTGDEITRKGFQDVLQAEESVFGTGTYFKVTLDGKLGALGSGVLEAFDSAAANVGTTTFTQIENVRLLENSRMSILDVKALSDNIADAVATDEQVINGLEGLTVNLTRTNPGVIYTIDGTLPGGQNSGDITAENGKYQATTGDYNNFEATQVYGAENLVAGDANEIVFIDVSQISANNSIDAGAEQGNSERLVEGQDIVVYNHTTMMDDGVTPVLDFVNASPTVSNDNIPYITVAPETSSETDTVKMTGGVLGSYILTDTLVDVELVSVDSAALMSKDGLDLSAIGNGATVAFGTEVDVQKSLGGEFDTAIDTLQEAEADKLESGGVAVTGSTLGNEILEISGITLLEKVTGSSGDDRIVIGPAEAMGNTALNNNDVALGRAFLLAHTATAQDVSNFGLYEFNLGAGDNDSLDFFNATDDIAVSIDTTGAGRNYVLVDDSVGGEINLKDEATDRVDIATGVELFWAVDDKTGGQSAIDLTASTVNTTIEFSKISLLHENETEDPNGDRSDEAENIVRGAELKDSATNSVFAYFMDRSSNIDTGDVNPTGLAHWDTIYGSPLFAETVIMTDNESESNIGHNMLLGAGENVVDYSARTAPVTASIMHVVASVVIDNQVIDDIDTQSVVVDGDTVTVSYAAYYSDGSAPNEKTLTVIASSQDQDTVNIEDLANGSVIDSYNLVDLEKRIVVEDVLDAVSAHEQSKVIYVQGFENITGSAAIDRLYGDGSSNAIDGAGGNDWIAGRGGHGPQNEVGQADILVGGTGNDRFIYEAESDSPTDITGNDYTNEGQDLIRDFENGDVLVFNTTDKGAVNSLAHDTVFTNGTATVDGDNTHAVTIQIDQNGDGSLDTEAVNNIKDHDYTIIDNSGSIDAGDVIFRVLQSSGQNIQHLDNEIGGIDGQYEIVYTSASESSSIAQPDEFHSLELNTADNGIGNSADKIDLRVFDFGVFEGNDDAGDGITSGDDLNDDGISDLVQDIIYSTPVTVYSSPDSVMNFFREGAVSNGAHRAVHVQLEAGSGTPGTDNGDDFRVFVDVNRDGNYSVNEDLVFDLVDVLDNGTGFDATGAGYTAAKAAFYDDANADAAVNADNGIFIFNDAQYQLWNVVTGGVEPTDQVNIVDEAVADANGNFVVTAQPVPEEFTFNAATGNYSIVNSFSAADDSLIIDIAGLSPVEVDNLAGLNGLPLPNGNFVSVFHDTIDGSTVINFGPDADNNPISLEIMGIAPQTSIDIDVI